MPDGYQSTPGVVPMPYGGRTIELLSPASQSLVLTGDGTAPATELLSWAPKNREAGTIEVRARIIGAIGGLGAVPVVRFSVDYGHGSGRWTEPHGQLPVIAGSPQLNYTLPGRGMVFRTSAREFRIAFSNAGVIAGAPLTSITVQVTINPVYGTNLQPYPYSYLANPTAGVVHPFPITARQWRLTGVDGLPVGAGPGVLFSSVTGGLFGVAAASSYDTFQPIPHDAVSFVASALMYAHYQ